MRLGKGDEGGLNPVQLASKNRKLVQGLMGRQQATNRLLILGIAMVVAVFGISIAIVLANLGDVAAVSLAFASQAAILTVLIQIIRGIWREKSFIEISIGVLENFEPAKAADFLEALAWTLPLRRNPAKKD